MPRSKATVAHFGLTYLTGDHLGSASLTTNAAGQKVSEERYLPYGATWSGSVPTDYQFTGQKLDTGTGLPAARTGRTTMGPGTTTRWWGGSSERIRWCPTRQDLRT